MAEKWERLVRDLRDDVDALKKENRALETRVAELESVVKPIKPVSVAPEPEPDNVLESAVTWEPGEFEQPPAMPEPEYSGPCDGNGDPMV